MSNMVGNESTGKDENEHQQEETTTNELSPGAQLSARREALNWSIEQVANQLNLAPRQIQAIESDNYAALPGMASARGFIRSYAKLLKIDATPLLQIIAKEVTNAEAVMPLRRALPATRFPESRLSPPNQNQTLLRVASVMALIFLLVGGLLVTQQIGMHSILPGFMQFGANNNSAIPVSPGSVATAGNGGAATSGDEETNVEKFRSVVMPGSVESNNAKLPDSTVNAVAEVAENGVASELKPVLPDDSVAAPVRSFNGDMKDVLTLKLREDSWIEIKRADNSTVVSSILKAGTTESFKITGPVAMTVGNAAGVEATLRGKPVELKAEAKSNVARLNLK